MQGRCVAVGMADQRRRVRRMGPPQRRSAHATVTVTGGSTGDGVRAMHPRGDVDRSMQDEPWPDGWPARRSTCRWLQRALLLQVAFVDGGVGDRQAECRSCGTQVAVVCDHDGRVPLDAPLRRDGGRRSHAGHGVVPVRRRGARGGRPLRAGPAGRRAARAHRASGRRSAEASRPSRAACASAARASV